MRWFALAVLAGCAGGGPGGRAEDSGGDGDGDGAGDGDGLVWVDADGTVVEGVVYMGAVLSYVDGDGYVWALDPLDPPADALQPDRTMQVVYADAACSDRWASYVAPPRVVMADADGVLLAAADDAAVVFLETTYAGDMCGLSGPAYSVAFADLVEVVEPVVSWAPPLHPEER